MLVIDIAIATGNEEKKTRVVEEAEDLGKTGRLFIRNLSYFTTEDELVEKFKKYGSIKEVSKKIGGNFFWRENHFCVFFNGDHFDIHIVF